MMIILRIMMKLIKMKFKYKSISNIINRRICPDKIYFNKIYFNKYILNVYIYNIFNIY